MSDPVHHPGTVTLDGKSLTLQDLARIARDPRVRVEISDEARDRVTTARKVIDDLVEKYKAGWEPEINAATDNPLFFEEEEGKKPFDHEFEENWPRDGEGRLLYNGKERLSYSAGNFHGEPIGMAADFLAIGLAELANISERRTQMLLDCHHNRNLPANLIPHRGGNSGLMIAQYCAAGIVSENKVLTHPATVDSIPTSANSEDHNAMATIAARKLRTVLRNTQAVLAIELLAAAQAVEWRVGMGIDPRTPRPAPKSLEEAQLEYDRFEKETLPERRKAIAEELGEGTRHTYRRVREQVETMLEDRTLNEDIRKVRAMIEANRLA